MSEVKMREVIVSRYKGLNQYEEIGKAKFHCYGVDYEELQNGPAHFSTAIIEWPDGRVENLPVHLIRFIKPIEGE